MLEYLIRRTDGDWFDLGVADVPNVFHPNSMPWTVDEKWDGQLIKVAGCDVSFSYEEPGLQISFKGTIDEDFARQVTEEILVNVEAATGQKGRIIEI